MTPYTNRIRDKITTTLLDELEQPYGVSRLEATEIAEKIIGTLVRDLREKETVQEIIPPTKPVRINEPKQAATDLGGDPKKIARTKGYSGDMCAGCGGMSMRRSGTCQVCDDCGSTNGGCS